MEENQVTTNENTAKKLSPVLSWSIIGAESVAVLITLIVMIVVGA